MDVGHQQAERAGDDHPAGGLALSAPEPLTVFARPRHVLVPVLFLVVLAALDLTVIAPILPNVLFDLRINNAEADRYVWIVSGYLLAYTLTIPLMGRLSDIIGRRTTFMLALVIFIAGSLTTATAGTLPGVIAARVVQGIGGGAMVPVAMAVVGDLLPRARRAGALGIVAAADTLGWVLGPIWGAAIEQISGHWRWIFYLNVPFGLVAGAVLLVAWRGAPRVERAPGRPDLLGALLLTVALLCLNLGLSVAAEPVGADGSRALGAAPNPMSAYRLPLLAVGLAALAALVVVELRARHPLIPPGIFRRSEFSAANTTNFLVGAALMAAMVNVPLIAALLVDEARVAVVSAQLLSAFSIAMALAAFTGGRVAERWGYRGITWVGLALGAIGFWQMSRWPNVIDLGRMAPDLAIAGLGLGLSIAPTATSAINAARRRDLGIASGLVIVMRLLGMTLGISALTAWAVQRLSTAMAALPPVIQQPGETLAEYLARQQQMAANLAIPATLGVIRDTFTVAAVLCLLAAVPVYWLTRRSEPAEELSGERGA